MTSAANQPPQNQQLQPTSEGEIVISGLDTPSTQETPTIEQALRQGLLDTSHEYAEPEDEDG